MIKNLIIEGYREVDEINLLSDVVLDNICDRSENRIHVMAQEAYNMFNEKGSVGSGWTITAGEYYTLVPKKVVNINHFRTLKDFIESITITIIPTDTSGYKAAYYEDTAKQNKAEIEILSDLFDISDMMSKVITIMKKSGYNKYEIADRIVENTPIVIKDAIGSYLAHELQHAYDDWRSGNKYTSDKLSKRYYRGDISKYEEKEVYMKLPHEYWARFTQTIKNLEKIPRVRGLDFKDYLKKYEKYEYGFEHLDDKDKNRVRKALYKYWTLNRSN